MGSTPPWIFYLLIYLAPVVAGFIGGRYLGRWVNFGLMLLVFHVDVALLRLGNTGEFPSLGSVLGALPAAMTVSPGGWLPLLLFLLVAVSASRRCTERINAH